MTVKAQRRKDQEAAARRCAPPRPNINPSHMTVKAQRREDEEAAARRCAPLLDPAQALLLHAASPMGAVRALCACCMPLRLLSGIHLKCHCVCRWEQASEQSCCHPFLILCLTHHLPSI